MLRPLILLLTVALLSAPLHAAQERHLNQIMSDIAKLMVDNYPLIVSKSRLSPAEKKTLDNVTQEMITLFEQAAPLINKKSNTYQISYDLILSHLKKTRMAFKQNNIIQARKRLRSMGEICSSCHTQDKQLRSLFPGKKRNAFTNDYEYAEFNYVTRNYDAAIRHYDKYLASDHKKTELEIIKPLQRLLTFHLQINEDVNAAHVALSKYLNLAQHSKQTKTQIQGWLAGLEKLATDKNVSQPLSFSKLQKAVTQYIGDTDQMQADLFSTPEDEVSRVWLRGQLYHYLNSNPPAEQVPIILYWLSICDRTLGYSYNYSFADLYLKDCVNRFPKHTYAGRCYKEYKNYITSSYSGSAGIFIPPEVEDELYEMKMRLKKGE